MEAPMKSQKVSAKVKIKKKKGEPASKDGLLVVEKRDQTRFTVELPFDYYRVDNEETWGIATDASEGGLLVYLHEVVEKGTLLNIEILFGKGSDLITIKAVAKVIWCDLAAKEAWGEYRYGVEFQSFSKGSLDQLKLLLKEVGVTQRG
jgi:c-di-GMP-binding flagellar brake protein YcgR